ncbi:MAG TPA: OsmC family protein [Propionibacteriaceae bacterium]|nr:OsmC family protein [Propionibacteriaceae bacterium]
MSVDHRSIRLTRISKGHYRAANPRGGTLDLGIGDEVDFSPVELLLVAVAGCSAADVDFITARRAEPVEFEVVASGRKVRDEQGNHLTDLQVTFRLQFADDDAGQAAAAVLPRAVQQSHDRLCTVTRTVEIGTPVSATIVGVPPADPVEGDAG